jgi:hypothetical protein
MFIRAISIAAFLALGLSACDKTEEAAPTAPVDVASSTPAASEPALIDASGALTDAQSSAMSSPDSTAALTEAADAAVNMAADGNKK